MNSKNDTLMINMPRDVKVLKRFIDLIFEEPPNIDQDQQRYVGYSSFHRPYIFYEGCIINLLN